MRLLMLLISSLLDKEVLMAALPRGPDILTVDQVAERLQVNRRTVLNLITAGSLVAFRVGRQWRIEHDDLQRYIDQMKNKPTTPPEGTEEHS
jgi:excisionase family DNA binding protein